jgi:secreted trypsin-like serine protease
VGIAIQARLVDPDLKGSPASVFKMGRWKLKKLLVAIVSSFLVLQPIQSFAIEGGEEARNHPRIVSIVLVDGKRNFYSACSGFLFAPKIVISAGHCQFHPFKNNEKWPDTHVFIGYPGQILSTNRTDLVQAQKVFGYKSYNTVRNLAAFNSKDFMIVVTKDPVAKVSWATAATEATFKDLIEKKAFVTIGGYGLSSEEERTMKMEGYKWPRTLTFPFVDKKHYNLVIENRLDKHYWPAFTDPYEKWGWTKTSKKTGAACDGDSGAGIFTETANRFVYVGLTAGPIDSPNCFNRAKWNIHGGLNRVNPIYYHSKLLDKAIKYAVFKILVN